MPQAEREKEARALEVGQREASLALKQTNMEKHIALKKEERKIRAENLTHVSCTGRWYLSDMYWLV